MTGYSSGQTLCGAQTFSVRTAADTNVVSTWVTTALSSGFDYTLTSAPRGAGQASKHLLVLRVESNFYAAQITALDVSFSIMVAGVCVPSSFTAPASPASATQYVITTAGTNTVDITIPAWV